MMDDVLFEVIVVFGYGAIRGSLAARNLRAEV
jgi:hypothetical protein